MADGYFGKPLPDKFERDAFSDEREALEWAIKALQDGLLAAHHPESCPFTRFARKPELCLSCNALRLTGFIRMGVNAKFAEMEIEKRLQHNDVCPKCGMIPCASNCDAAEGFE